MGLLNKVSKGYWAITDIGVTQDIRPEEAKHIRYLNIGAFLLCIINLGYFFQGVTDERTAIIIPITQISVSALSLLVFVFQKIGRYNTARVYCFSLYYASALFIYPLSGKEVLDHYFIFVAIGYAFLVFPRKEKLSMAIIIVLAFLCYFVILFLYRHVEPAVHADPSALELGNQIVLYIVFMMFVVFMMSAKNFADKTEDDLMEEREKLSARDFYGKVIKRIGERGQIHVVYFTSVPAEVDAYFQAHRQYAANPATN